jgi:hypothetical protein
MIKSLKVVPQTINKSFDVINDTLFEQNFKSFFLADQNITSCGPKMVHGPHSLGNTGLDQDHELVEQNFNT